MATHFAKFRPMCCGCELLLNQATQKNSQISRLLHVTSVVRNPRGGNWKGTGIGTDYVPDTSTSIENITEGSNAFDIQRPPLPLMTSRKLEYPNKYLPPKQAWLETLGSIEDEKLGIIDLHPDIFGAYPRIDILYDNVKWQMKYRKISYEKTKTRAEKRGGGRKPRAQKGLGAARHGSIRSPIIQSGGKAHGPRGPKSFFYMLPVGQRVLGLRVALSIKFAQNDLHIVDNLNIPTDKKEYMEELLDTRFWGFSCLFVDDTDMMPENISLALDDIPHFNLMPVYGLNVYSILKHETLVLTLAAVEKLEQKLLYQMQKTKLNTKYHYNERYSIA